MTLRKLKTLAASMGATVEDQKIGLAHCCEVFSPKGKMFSCDSIHILVDETHQPWKPDYSELMRRMSYGLDDCEDPECEWCNPDETDLEE